MKPFAIVFLIAGLVVSTTITKANNDFLSSSSPLLQSLTSSDLSVSDPRLKGNSEKFESLVMKISKQLSTVKSDNTNHDILLQKMLGYHHQELERHHKNKKQQTQALDETDQQQPFLIEIINVDACQGASDCHTKMMNRLGVDKHSYEIISKDIALVTTTWGRLDAVSSFVASSDASSDPDAVSLNSYMALHPSLKLSKAVAEMSKFTEDKERCVKSSTSTTKLLVVLSPPQSEESYETFLSFLDSMSQNNSDSIEEIITDLDERAGYYGAERFGSSSSEVESGSSNKNNNNSKRRLSSETRSRALRVDELGSKKKLFVQVLIKDCSKVYEVAEQFSLRSEVIYIDRVNEISMTNQFARLTCDDGGNPLTSNGHIVRHFDFRSDGAPSYLGMVDTGLDLESAWFYDYAWLVDQKSTSAASSSPDVWSNSQFYRYTKNLNSIQFNTKHRKVNTYFAFADQDDGYDGHGTSVAGTLAGALGFYPGLSRGAFDALPLFDGMNRQAKINVFDIQYKVPDSNNQDDSSYRIVLPIHIKDDMFLVLKKAGSPIICNSWGTLDTSVPLSDRSYDYYSYQSDAFMYENPDTLLVFAAGNYGESGSLNILSPASAKNVLAVGASMSDQISWKYFLEPFAGSPEFDKDVMATFSSLGPTFDGRLKPDIVAPGHTLSTAKGGFNSSIPNSDRVRVSGTSISAPVVAGFAGYIRKYFMDGYYNDAWARDDATTPASNKVGFVPSGALLKAMIVHSGKAMRPGHYRSAYGLYPSVQQGYGRMQLDSVLKFAETTIDNQVIPAVGPKNLFVIGSAWNSNDKYQSVAIGSSHSYWITIPEDTIVPEWQNLIVRVTLSYTDPPVDPLSTQVMSSRLFISAIATDCTTIDSVNAGNCFYTPYKGYGGSTTISNVQMIDIPGVPGKTYQIKIHNAIESLTTSQPYALVVTGPFEISSKKPVVKAIDNLSMTQVMNEIYIGGLKNGIVPFGNAFKYSSPPVVPSIAPSFKPTVKPSAKLTPNPTRRPTTVMVVPLASPTFTATPTVTGGGSSDVLGANGANTNGNNSQEFASSTSFALMISFIILVVIVLAAAYTYYVCFYHHNEASDPKAAAAGGGGATTSTKGNHNLFLVGEIELEEVTLDRATA